jgi:hypothetical protein
MENSQRLSSKPMMFIQMPLLKKLLPLPILKEELFSSELTIPVKLKGIPGMISRNLFLENMRYRQFTRNPMITSFLAGYGYMERRGKGILRMLRLCEQHNIKCELSLTPDDNEFVVTYRAD